MATEHYITAIVGNEAASVGQGIIDMQTATFNLVTIADLLMNEAVSMQEVTAQWQPAAIAGRAKLMERTVCLLTDEINRLEDRLIKAAEVIESHTPVALAA